MKNVDVDAAIEAVSSFSQKTMRGRPNIQLNFDDITLPCEKVWQDDVLGGYCAKNVRVTLYIRAIQKAAIELKVSESVLCMIVLLHELGHWFWHMALDSDGNNWKDYGKDAVPDCRETLAQLCVVWGAATMERETNKIRETFFTLMEKQPQVYQLDRGNPYSNQKGMITPELVSEFRQNPSATSSDLNDSIHDSIRYSNDIERLVSI